MEHGTAHRKSDESPKGTLYVVATPIGNLRDITLRALDVLKEVALIAAEDTRVTAKLLNHYGITGRLTPLHEHNERRAVPALLALLARGDSVALVSDAGTPAISDPGARLACAARAAGYRVAPVPGANAAVAALSAAGVADSRFLFCGFLSARRAERRRELAELAPYPFPLVFYEAPHRVLDAIADMQVALGERRRIVIARELTKLFETIHACSLGEAAAWLSADADRRRGEFVLVVEGAPGAPAGDPQAERTLQILLAELPLKQAVGFAMKITGAKRNALYERALKLTSERETASHS